MLQVFQIKEERTQIFWLFLLFFFFYLGGLGSLACSHSELIMKLWMVLTVGRTSWMDDQPVARPLPTQENTITE
jgi:hypothetical protein